MLLDYLGVTAARRNGGLGGAILKMLAAREAGRRTVLVEAEAERSGGPEEERPLRLRRLGFYARNGCTQMCIRDRRRSVTEDLLPRGLDENPARRDGEH